VSVKSLFLNFALGRGGGCSPAAPPPPDFYLDHPNVTQTQVKIKILFKTLGFRSLSEGLISQDVKGIKQKQSYRNLEKPKRLIWPSCKRMQQSLWLYHRYPATCAGFRLLSPSLAALVVPQDVRLSISRFIPPSHKLRRKKMAEMKDREEGIRRKQ
jgi:hypothetical protein